MDSFEALRDTIISIAETTTAPQDAEPRRGPTTLLACSGCGAWLPIADTHEVTCAYCEARTIVPAELRLKLTTARRLAKDDHRRERVLRKLLDQPGARSTNILLAATLAVLISGVVAVAIGVSEGQRRLAEFAMVPGIALALLCRIRIADRAALRVVSLGYAALGPSRPGAHFACRCCEAPLPSVDTISIACLYCHAENIVGIDLGRRVVASRAQQRSLDETLRGRGEVRREGLVAVGIVVACLVAIVTTFR